MNIRGGIGRATGGFTVIEVMIVLAVVSGMFIMASSLISGQQAKADFNVGARLLRSQIQTILNETASGYYPNADNLKCTIGSRPFFSSTFPIPLVTQEPSKQGSSSDCIFIGNTLVFGPNKSNVKHIIDYKVFPMVGFRKGGLAGTDVGNFFDARPHAIASPPWANIPDASRTLKLPNGLQYAGVKVQVDSEDGTKTIQMGATSSDDDIGIFVTNSLGSKFYNGDSAQGSKQQELRWIANPNHDYFHGETGIVGWIDDEWLHASLQALGGNAFTPYPKVYELSLCFASGGTDQSTAVSFKGSSSEPSYEIFDGLKCGGIVP